VTLDGIRNSRFLRFCIVGAGGFVVDASALALAIYGMHLDPYSGRLFSYLCAATFTWWGNRRLTFASHAAKGVAGMASEWLRFILANGFGGLVNYTVYSLCVAFAPAPIDNYFVALAFGVASGLAINFTLSSRLVFRTKT
jgi:putative flippase GtrA